MIITETLVYDTDPIITGEFFKIEYALYWFMSILVHTGKIPCLSSNTPIGSHNLIQSLGGGGGGGGGGHFHGIWTQPFTMLLCTFQLKCGYISEMWLQTL